MCHRGIIGGALYLDENALTYKTNKLTIDYNYKNLAMPIKEIKEISWKWIVFPVATVHMQDGKAYTFLIFNKSRFEKWFREYSKQDTE